MSFAIFSYRWQIYNFNPNLKSYTRAAHHVRPSISYNSRPSSRTRFPLRHKPCPKSQTSRTRSPLCRLKSNVFTVTYNVYVPKSVTTTESRMQTGYSSSSNTTLRSTSTERKSSLVVECVNSPNSYLLTDSDQEQSCLCVSD